jgi:proteasome accessory factor A
MPARPAAPRRVLGLETEYAVLYRPDDASDERRPPFSLIERVLFESLLWNLKSAPSLGLKGGHFLENGGLAHLEFFLHEQADTPILELATPECASARELTLYQRAFDALLGSASDRSWKALLKHGFQGRLLFGKNNLDSRGSGYGCHENYLVWGRLAGAPRIRLMACLPWVVALFLPWAALFVASFVVFVLALAARRAPPRLWGWTALPLALALADAPLGALLLAVQGIASISALVSAAALSPGLSPALESAARAGMRLLRNLYFALNNLAIAPGTLAYAAALRRFVYATHIRGLTGHLVTRQILCGAGWFNPRRGRFELSQRAPLTRSVAKIVVSGKKKTIFDLKGLLYEPMSIFREHRRLTICSGDSNLSDIPNFLKLGCTEAILDRIEAGADYSDLFPEDPIAAFRAVSEGGPWKLIRLRSGRESSAIEIQREYLRRLRSSPPAGAGRDDDDAILDAWEENLDLLAEAPGRLGERLDWAAKKSLVDRAVLSTSNWSVFAAWCEFFRRAGRAALDESRGLESVLRGAARSAGAWLLRRGLDPADFAAQRSLFLQCSKLNLRYHEISCDPGYQRQLEAEGLIARLTSDAEVRSAIREAPATTRARVRSYFIKRFHSVAGAVRVSWSRVFIPGSFRSFPIADPFEHRIPGDG